MQSPHIQNIQQQIDNISIQAKSIAATAKATYAKNTNLLEENTNLQSKICLHEGHINMITGYLHQLQMQTAMQEFKMNIQTMGPGRHNNT